MNHWNIPNGNAQTRIDIQVGQITIIKWINLKRVEGCSKNQFQRQKFSK